MIVPMHCIRFFDIHSFKNKAIVPHPESAHHVGIYIYLYIDIDIYILVLLLTIYTTEVTLR